MAAVFEHRLVPLEAAGRAWTELSAQTVRRLCGLGIEPWRVAAALHRHGMLPQSRLTDLCHTHKVAISRAIDMLVRDKQWIMRLPISGDGRIRHLVLTEKGLAEVAVVAEALTDLRHRCLAGLADEDIARMQDLLRRVEAGIRQVDLDDRTQKPRRLVRPAPERTAIALGV